MFLNSCIKCQNKFPNRMKIDGQIRFLRNRKYCCDCVPFNSGRGPNAKKFQLPYNFLTHKLCKGCNKILLLTRFYTIKNRLSHTCKDCEKTRVKNRGINFKKECIKYKGGKCEICGYNKYFGGLSFHHINNKKYQLSELRSHSLKSKLVKDELSKCKLLCENCHRESHFNKNEFNKTLLDINGILCTKCNQTKSKDSFYENRYTYCIDCENKKCFEFNQKYKLLCLDYKQDYCEICGYDKCTAALEFHHKNPKEKLFNISNKISASLSAEIKTELDKCQVLCCNCHLEQRIK